MVRKWVGRNMASSLGKKEILFSNWGSLASARELEAGAKRSLPDRVVIKIIPPEKRKEEWMDLAFSSVYCTVQKRKLLG